MERQPDDAARLADGDLVMRRAELDDIAAIVRLLADDALGRSREVLPPDDGSPVDESYLGAFADIAADPNQMQVVAVFRGTIVGCMQLTVIPGLSQMGARRMQVEGVRIASAVRGRGYGDRMVRFAIEQARTRGCRMVQLTSNAARGDAQRFYARLGFVGSHVGMKLTVAD